MSRNLIKFIYRDGAVLQIGRAKHKNNSSAICRVLQLFLYLRTWHGHETVLLTLSATTSLILPHHNEQSAKKDDKTKKTTQTVQFKTVLYY